MFNETIILLQNLTTVSSGSAFSFTNKTPGPGYYRQDNSTKNALYDFTNFVGTVKIQASLDLYPGNNDWFDVAGTTYTASSPSNSTESYSFNGNFVWIRIAYNLQSGRINRISVGGITVTTEISNESTSSIDFANITNKPTTLAGYGITDSISASDLGAFEFTGSVISTTDSSSITIDQAVNLSSDVTVGGDLLPSVANGGDLGSSARPWNSLYVSNNTIFIGGTALAIDELGRLTIDGTISSGGGNPFDQDLNTDDSVTFDSVGATTVNVSQINGTNPGNELVIQANNNNWNFGTDGTLTFPDGTTTTGDTVIAPDVYNIQSIGNTLIQTSANVGAKTWTFGTDGSLEFPAGYILPNTIGAPGQTLIAGGQGSVSWANLPSTGDNNIWVQTFESQDGAPTDIVSIASSVEYDSAGNVIALFSHFNDNDNSRYYSVGKYTTTGTKIWTARFEDGFQTDGWGLAVDNDSNSIYVAGKTLVSNESGYDVSTLTKLDAADGTIEWSKVYDFGFVSDSPVVDVASDGNPVMVGYASNGTDNYITTTKVDPADGTIIWSRALDGQGNEEAFGMAVGPTGEVVAVGYMTQLGVLYAAATLSVNPASNPLWTVGGSINFVNGITADYSFTDGVPTFTNVVDTTGGRSVDDVIVTVLGDDLGGVTGVDDMIVKVATLAANDTDDRMLVVKYAANGTIAWQKAIQFDAGFDCRGADADIDSDGNIYVTGSYQYSFEGGTTSALSILKLDSTGVKQWSRRVTGNCETFGVSVVVGADDKLYLSAMTGNNNDVNNAFTWVAAKYGINGTVEWQRLIDNTTGWSFTGDIFSGEGGGSNIAVKQDYVVLAGGFGLLIEEPPRATVVQVAATGDVFSVGDWAFTAASFSGVLNSSASDITVVDAQKFDADNGEGEVTVTTAELTTEVSGFLIGTLYTVGGDNSLINGAYTVTLENTGTLTLPAGGTITEGYVTSNPTIQLTPASPDVASQKLVIKGGALYNFTDNGISINYSNNTALVGDTLTFYISSNTYADQTLYWWIYPEGANISDPGSGTVAVNEFGNGDFSFTLDSDDNEFTIRVSPEEDNYGPGVIGVQSGLINPDAPTFDVDYHLHLTTGNLAETSIILGTDNHNVRTTTDGGISMTTTRGTVLFGNTPDNPITGSSHFHIMKADADNVDLFFGDDYNYVKLPSTQGVEISANGPLWTFGIDGALTVPGDIKSETGINIDINLSDSTLRRWSFGEDGVITLPNSMTIDGSGTGGQTVIIGGDNTQITIDNNGAPPGFSVTTNTLMSGPTGTAHTWRFGPDGELTLPGAVIKSTVAKTGGTASVGAATAITVTNSPNANWTNGTGAVANGINFVISVDGSGNATVSTINDGGTGHFVGETFGPVPGTAFGGATPADDMYFEVTAIDLPTTTALDLTKSVNKLTDGNYTLANGVEGQIMYLVRQNGSTAANIFVEVASARWDGTVYSDQPVVPFQIPFTDMITIIFTDGAWQASTFGSLT